MKLYLVRHGESEANVAGIPFTLAYASRFPRACQTAEILVESLGLDLPVIQDARLDERRSGLDGRPVEAFNGLVRPDPMRIKPERGESFLEQMERLRSFLDA